MNLVSATTVVGSRENVPVEAIRDDQSSHQAQAIVHRMAVRALAAAVERRCGHQSGEELTEIKEEKVNSTCGERNLEQIERSMKTFSSCGLLSDADCD